MLFDPNNLEPLIVLLEDNDDALVAERVIAEATGEAARVAQLLETQLLELDGGAEGWLAAVAAMPRGRKQDLVMTLIDALLPAHAPRT